MKDSFIKMTIVVRAVWCYFSLGSRDVNKLAPAWIGDHIGSLMHCRVEGNRLRDIMKLAQLMFHLFHLGKSDWNVSDSIYSCGCSTKV